MVRHYKAQGWDSGAIAEAKETGDETEDAFPALGDPYTAFPTSGDPYTASSSPS